MESRAFAPTSLAGLKLRNRIIKTATFEGMTPDGIPTDALIRHHRDLAAGGVGMTTVAYCGVTDSAKTFPDQMHMHEGIRPQLERLAEAVHKEGGALSAQLAHCGTFTRNRQSPRRPLGPSFTLNEYGLMNGRPFGYAMDEDDIRRTIDEYGAAAAFARSVGFDAVEIHMGHGYLLSQFISPLANRRRDAWGGSLENRMRLPLAVLQRIRETVGEDYPVLAKFNLDDGVPGGLHIEDSIAAVRMLEAGGLNAVVMSGGYTAKAPLYLLRGGRPLREMIAVDPNPLQRFFLRLLGAYYLRRYPFENLFFLDLARQMRRAVQMPLVYLGGCTSLQDLDTCMVEGFDFVAMGRALIADPEWVHKVRDSGHAYKTVCNACNKCITAMDTPGGTRCVLFEEDFLKK